MTFDSVLRGLLYAQMAVGILFILVLLCHMLLIAADKLKTYWLRYRFGSVVYREIIRFMRSPEGREMFGDKFDRSKEWKAVKKNEGLL